MTIHEDDRLNYLEEEHNKIELQKNLEQENLKKALLITKKINVSTEIATVHHELNGSIESAIEYLQKKLQEANEKGVKYKLDYRKEYGYYNDHYDVIGLVEVREETDEEFKSRVQKDLEQKAAAVEQRRLQFEQLSKEFGN